MGIQAGRITKRSIELSRCLQLTVLTVVAASGLLAQSQSRTQTFPLRDSTGLIPLKVKTESVNYLGRKCVRITMDGDDRDGLALLPGTDFQDGVIEADNRIEGHCPSGRSISWLSRNRLPRAAGCIPLRAVLRTTWKRERP
jgi:hypothetical protein